MAKGVYACIDGVSRNVKKIPVGIDGVSRSTKKGYACVGGVGREFFGGSTISDLEVGQSVFMNVNGVRTEFLIVHIGCPWSDGGTYTNADGTWLLMKDIYTERTWDSRGGRYYADCDIHKYLTTTFFNLLDEGVASQILQAGLPYTTSSSSASGALGSVTATVFLLSVQELYGVNEVGRIRKEGGALDYFKYSTATGLTDVNQRRYAYYKGNLSDWWTRTHYYDDQYNVEHVRGQDGFNRPGQFSQRYYNYTGIGVRPAMIFPHETAIDENFNIIA